MKEKVYLTEQDGEVPEYNSKIANQIYVESKQFKTGTLWILDPKNREEYLNKGRSIPGTPADLDIEFQTTEENTIGQLVEEYREENPKQERDVLNEILGNMPKEYVIERTIADSEASLIEAVLEDLSRGDWFILGQMCYVVKEQEKEDPMARVTSADGYDFTFDKSLKVKRVGVQFSKDCHSYSDALKSLAAFLTGKNVPQRKHLIDQEEFEDKERQVITTEVIRVKGKDFSWLDELIEQEPLDDIFGIES